MSELDGGLAVMEPDDGLMAFDAIDVTGTRHVHVANLQRDVPVGAVTKAVAAQMSLPDTTPYSLHDGRGAVLDDARPIAEQIKPGETVTLAPKAHLGGSPG